jgi:phospholipid/cholesterol/gamma-HCH transport system permease protein
MTTALLRFPQAIGQGLLGGLDHVGRVSLLVVEMIRGLPQVRTWFPLTMREAYNVGIGSLFIVLLVSGFAGAVTALQAGYQFTGNIPYYVVGSLVVESVVLELGPVLTGLILAGRIGAKYAAELGTMRVTEQIDALESLGRSPVSYLVIPRVLAGLLMVPVLVVVADLVGVVSGWWFARQVLPLTDADFVYGALVVCTPGSSPDRCRLRLRCSGLLAPVRCLLLPDQGVLLCGLDHHYPVLHGV